MKNNSLLATVEKATSWLVLSLLVLVPLLVVPFTRNLIVDTKIFLIFAVTLVTLLGLAVKALVEKRWVVAVSPLTAPLALFGLAVLVSTLAGNRYPVESLLGIGGVYLALSLVGTLAPALIPANFTKTALRLMIWASGLLGLSMILQQFGWGPTQLINRVSGFNLPHTLQFNLSGSSFVAIQVLVVGLVAAWGLWKTDKKFFVRPALSTSLSSLLSSLFTPLSVLFSLISLLLGVWSVLPGQIAAVTITPFTASWTVMLNGLGSLPGALIGNGPASYANLYAQYKPLWTNGQDYWQFNFGTAANTPLTLISTLGLVGLAAWVFLVVKTFKQLKSSSKETRPLLWTLLATFALQILLPTNIVIVGLQIALVTLWTAANRLHFSLLQFKKPVKTRTFPARLEFLKRFANKGFWLVRVTASLMVVAVVGLGYLLGRAYGAHYYMYEANKALATRDAVQVYEYQRKAVALNPYLDSLRREYGYTNLQVAIALANNADITETERQQVVQLISQAIREGRAATLLDPGDVDNWNTLADIYRNLIGAANEASTWAINSYVSAVQVNPTNPLLRLQIGQLLLTDDKAEDAVNFFAQAVQLKPDLPAGYYQLGLGLQALGQFENARQAWQQAMTLLPADSQDYATVNAQLQALEATMPTGTDDQASAQTEVNTTPNVTEQNVQAQESDIVNPGQDAQLAQ